MEIQNRTGERGIHSLLTPRQVKETALKYWRCRNKVQLPLVKFGGNIRSRQEDIKNLIHTQSQETN